MIHRFILNEVSYFGLGARKMLPQEIKRLGLHKALVATDKELIRFGVAQKVLDVLEEAGVPYELFSEIKPNPTVSNVKAGVKAFSESGADFILAIGGGSSIDTAKAIGIITNNPSFSDVVSLEGVADTQRKSVPIIALPTTAGTAAEVTINYVITDEEKQKKMVCVDPNDIPAIAIVDAELMYTLPKSLTAATGMDALTHAIEGLITKGAWEMSDMFEIKAIEMINRYLETAVKERTAAADHHGIQCTGCPRQICTDRQSHGRICSRHEPRRSCQRSRTGREGSGCPCRYSPASVGTGHPGKRSGPAGRRCLCRCLHPR